MKVLRAGSIVVPDLVGALDFLDVMDIEQLVDDRVIWAYQFTPQQTLLHHAITTSDKEWRKGIRKFQENFA